MSARLHRIDPERLLEVVFKDNDGDEFSFIAIGCRYVTARNIGGENAIAIEVLYDRVHQPSAGGVPTTAYDCDAFSLVLDLQDPRKLVRIRPYEAASKEIK